MVDILFGAFNLKFIVYGLGITVLVCLCACALNRASERILES